MAPEKRKISVGAYKWYHTRGLNISPSLAGTVHAFRFQGCNIEVRVPNRPAASESWDKGSAIYCRSWRTRKGRKHPCAYDVRRVSLVLDTNVTRSIREDAIGRVNTQLFSKRDAGRLQKFSERHAEMLDKAFLYWASVVRWKCQSYSIMHSRDDLGISDSRLYLVEYPTMQRFFATPYVVQGAWKSPITKREWTAVQEALRLQEVVPLWQLSIGEAHHRYSSGDSRGAILELAISVEVLVRHLVQRFLSESAPSDFRKMVSRIGLRQLLDKWGGVGFERKAWASFASIKKDILEVITVRDSIMHRGNIEEISRSDFQRYSAAVQSFAVSGEKELRSWKS